ncbi:MAG: penicillin-binding transpeptidase domain-containing protein [Aggregatilineales bacterium]
MNSHSVNRLTAVLLIAFLAIGVSLTYWSVFATDSMLARSDNPRHADAAQAIQRGALYDRNGQLLVQSVSAGQQDSGLLLMKRTYPEQAAVSALGYFSILHGVGGVEEAFNSTLTGDDQLDAGQRAMNDLLHRPQVGNDVRLTLDLTVQRAAAAAMARNPAYRGAVVAIDVPSGAIRALLSVPGYDPATLDDPGVFDRLSKDPTAPLLNRAIQGIYQPGGALETPILAELLTEHMPLDQTVMGGDQAVVLPAVTLECARSPNSAAVTLQMAYANACPFAFGQAAYDHPTEVQHAIDQFGLTRSPTVAHFLTIAGLPPPPLDAMPHISTVLDAQGVGQGQLTVTPLQMALVAATIANHGNDVSLYLADATRVPGGDWQPLPVPSEQPAVIARGVADTLRVAMRAAVTDGAARAADQGSVPIYGHASLAYAGPQKTPLAWFIGFVDTPNGHSVAVAVVLEGAPDPSVAAEIGDATLSAASPAP